MENKIEALLNNLGDIKTEQEKIQKISEKNSNQINQLNSFIIDTQNLLGKINTSIERFCLLSFGMKTCP